MGVVTELGTRRAMEPRYADELPLAFQHTRGIA